MEKALDSVAQVSALVAQISASTTEQLAGVSQVNDAIGQLDGITQQNATMVERLGAASQALLQQAGVVASSVKVFRV
jgi:methyl-accepting chemotaxis protein